MCKWIIGRDLNDKTQNEKKQKNHFLIVFINKHHKASPQY